MRGRNCVPILASCAAGKKKDYKKKEYRWGTIYPPQSEFSSCTWKGAVCDEEDHDGDDGPAPRERLSLGDRQHRRVRVLLEHERSRLGRRRRRRQPQQRATMGSLVWKWGMRRARTSSRRGCTARSKELSRMSPTLLRSAGKRPCS